MASTTDFHPGTGETICKILRRGNFREMACAQVGITSQTFRNWLRRGANGEEPFAKFSQDVMKAEAESEDLLITGIRRHGSEDWRALAWIAEHSPTGERWGYRARLKADLQEMVHREAKRILDLVEKHAGIDVATKILADLADEESSEGAAGGIAKPSAAGAVPSGVGERGVH